MTAKIDQMKSTVHIFHCTSRESVEFQNQEVIEKFQEW
jgi:hypothetical protein